MSCRAGFPQGHHSLSPDMSPSALIIITVASCFYHHASCVRHLKVVYLFFCHITAEAIFPSGLSLVGPGGLSDVF